MKVLKVKIHKIIIGLKDIVFYKYYVWISIPLLAKRLIQAIHQFIAGVIPHLPNPHQKH